MLERLKAQVFCASLELFHHQLTIENYGSVSGIDREQKRIVIKPAGVSFPDMQIADMVVLDYDGNILEGDCPPSVDFNAHRELYRAFPRIESIAHSRSRWATIFAQLGRSIPAYNSLHSNFFGGEVPCTRRLTQMEIETDFQRQVGLSIVQTFRKYDANKTPAVLVQNHGAYAWGMDPSSAVRNATVLEECAMMAWHSIALGGDHMATMPADLEDWYQRQPRD